ncbi:MAG: hypothetical protein ACM3NW_05725 [Syntrophomonadaceae bacterium]
MKRVLWIVTVLLVVGVILPAVASACPLCKEAASATEKPGQTGVWRGMYWSILLMVSAPFAMVGAMIVAVRRARRRMLASSPPSPPPLAFPERGNAGARP